MDRAVPASFWRGGTSRAVLFRNDDLAGYRPEQIEAIILASLGSPDPDCRQIDGLGGGISSLSKAAIVGTAPAGSGAEVAFRFAQVEVAEPRVDFTGNCGNISAAIAPFAVNKGLVEAASSGSAPIEVLSLNTGQRFVTRVPLRDGRYDPSGDFVIGGVPGSGARLTLEYLEPDGSIGRGALPTGRLRDRVDVPGCGAVPVSIVDVGNPAVFVAAEALGAPEAATALPSALDAAAALQERLECIRCEAAVRIGLADSPAEAAARQRTVPKVALVGAPAAYRTTSGGEVPAADVDLVARLISMGRTHRTMAMTGAMACAAAAAMDGSVVAEVAAGPAQPGGESRVVRLGHPAGVLGLSVTADCSSGTWRVSSLTMDRTAREIMRGAVQVPQAYLDGEAWFLPGSSR